MGIQVNVFAITFGPFPDVQAAQLGPAFFGFDA
jgi:hypothetical protein